MLSDVDTWHQCSVHGNGVMHPAEAEYEAEIKEEVEAAAKAAGLSVEDYLKSLEEQEKVEEAQRRANRAKESREFYY